MSGELQAEDGEFFTTEDFQILLVEDDLATYSASYGTQDSLTVSGLDSLANSGRATSNVRDNSVNLFLDDLVEVVLTTAASGVNSDGYAEVWAAASLDNTNYGDSANQQLLGIVNTKTASTVYRKTFSVGDAFGGKLPKYYKIAVVNRSGAALAASGNSVSVMGVKLSSA